MWERYRVARNKVTRVAICERTCYEECPSLTYDTMSRVWMQHAMRSSRSSSSKCTSQTVSLQSFWRCWDLMAWSWRSSCCRLKMRNHSNRNVRLQNRQVQQCTSTHLKPVAPAIEAFFIYPLVNTWYGFEFCCSECLVDAIHRIRCFKVNEDIA